MTNMKSTKKALITSALCLLLCVSMLVGATFAWFTDSVSTTNNIITAGNLDVNLYWSTNGTDWTPVDANTNIFKTGTLWEPGHTEVVYLKVVNEGTLALKYDLQVNVASEVKGTNVAGEEFKLSDYILYNVTNGVTTFANSAEARGSERGNKLNAPYNKATTLEAGKETVLTMVVFMPTTVGNEANYLKDTAIPTINLGINLFATQQTFEEDSYGPDYDADALVCDILAKPETIDDILATVEPGTVIGLAAGYYDEIVLTQDNLTLVSKTGVVGFLNLNAKDGATIDGVTFDQSGAKQVYTFATGNTQKATDYVANITGDTNSPKAADNVTIKNCTFTNTSGVALTAASKYAPICFNEQGAATERCDSITIENCVFACNATQYICLNYIAEGTVVIKNNVFGGNGFGTEHNTIQATSNAANWTVTGNEFYNWNTEKTAIGSSKQGSNTVTWTVTGNDFNNDDGAVVLALKTSYKDTNTVLNVADNTALSGYATIVTTPVNGENETVYGGHKIQLNDDVVVAEDNNALKNALANDATIYVPSGEYNLSSMAQYDGVTIVGAADGSTVVGGENTSTGFGSDFGKNTTIQNVTFSGYSNGVRYSYAKGGTTVFDNCTFAGDSTYGFHIDESKGATFIFNNCTFVGFNAFAGDLVSVTFNNCTFLSNGNYGHTNIWSVGYFNDCTWGEGATFGPRGDAVIFVDGVQQ